VTGPRADGVGGVPGRADLRVTQAILPGAAVTVAAARLSGGQRRVAPAAEPQSKSKEEEKWT